MEDRRLSDDSELSLGMFKSFWDIFEPYILRWYKNVSFSWLRPPPSLPCMGCNPAIPLLIQLFAEVGVFPSLGHTKHTSTQSCSLNTSMQPLNQTLPLNLIISSGRLYFSCQESQSSMENPMGHRSTIMVTMSNDSTQPAQMKTYQFWLDFEFFILSQSPLMLPPPTLHPTHWRPTSPTWTGVIISPLLLPALYSQWTNLEVSSL